MRSSHEWGYYICCVPFVVVSEIEKYFWFAHCRIALTVVGKSEADHWCIIHGCCCVVGWLTPKFLVHSSNLVSIGILVNGANLVLSNELSDTNLLLLDEVVEE